ncbi:A-type flagellin [Pseudobythopirellula maris]|uniref:Flagellin n=1 Tax=Pseudobythopirellula maris TaxID=2527991 RepID=A0A5C5ZHA5_9BACT|nr:flagellin [Pseudobythopirellula maris]TWT86538.1 A-type flagellin [Pseudobythopirellula maris]
MLTVFTTGGQLTAFNNLSNAQDRLGDTTERLSTGLRINQGSDDPAGLFAAESIRGDLTVIGAERRSASAERYQLNLQQSGRQQATGVLQEVRGLVVEAAGDTSTPEQRMAIQTQIDSSLDALRQIENTTGVSFSADLEGLASGGSANAVDGDAAAAQEVVDNEIDALTAASAEAGAYEKYTLDVDEQLAQDREVVLARALSETVDADFAEESSNLTKNQILFQTAIKTFGVLDRTRGEAILELLG